MNPSVPDARRLTTGVRIMTEWAFAQLLFGTGPCKVSNICYLPDICLKQPAKVCGKDCKTVVSFSLLLRACPVSLKTKEFSSYCELNFSRESVVIKRLGWLLRPRNTTSTYEFPSGLRQVPISARSRLMNSQPYFEGPTGTFPSLTFPMLRLLYSPPTVFNGRHCGTKIPLPGGNYCRRCKFYGVA